MSRIAIVRERFNRESSGYIQAQIVDQDNNPVDPNDLTEATLTLWDVETKDASVSPVAGIINSRDAQDILGSGSPLGTNDVEYLYGDNLGYFKWTLQPADNVIVNPRRQVERHWAIFTFGWTTGQFMVRAEIEVANV